MPDRIEGYFIRMKISKPRNIITKRIVFHSLELFDGQDFPAIVRDSSLSDIFILKRH